VSLFSLVSELKRRRVFRVAAVYAVVAWLVIQIAETTFPYLGLPAWAVTLVIVLALLGFPIALVLAWAFDITPEGVVRTEASESPRPTTPRSRRPWDAQRLAAVGGVVMFVAAGGAFVVFGGSFQEAGDAVALDDAAVVVLPFRVSGADPSLAYLREGMVDLLAAKLTGEGGPRAASPRSVLSAWRQAVNSEEEDLPDDEALRLTRDLGAGRLLLGEVVSAPGQLILSASVLDAAAGKTRARATAEGPADSLPVLVDRLVAQLLTLEAGHERRLSTLTTTSLPALRAYLEGQAAYRRGDYLAASQGFDRALQLDSTFAVAAVELMSASGWVGGTEFPAAPRQRAARVAWRERETLTPRDRALLGALLGAGSPEPATEAQVLTALRGAVESIPDDPELWYRLGESYIHFGAALGHADWAEWSTEAFRRAMTLDPEFHVPVTHLVELSVRARDTAEVRRLVQSSLARDPAGENADYLRWHLYRSTGDAPALDAFLARLDSVRWSRLSWIGLSALDTGIGMEDAHRALQLMHARAGTPSERGTALSGLHRHAVNRGRPAEARAHLEERARGSGNPSIALRHRVLDALYGSGESADAEAAARELVRRAGTSSGSDANEQAGRRAELCVLEQWRISRGETAHARRTIQELRSAGGPPGNFDEACVLLLDAQLAATERLPDAAARRERLENFLLAIPYAVSRSGAATEWALQRVMEYWYVALARLHEGEGNPAAALASHRRRFFFYGGEPYIADSLREEGRLAALLGDRDGAIHAYRHYLALRYDPEPALRPEAEQVRAELARLTQPAGG
jgi:tetratricopeptide (TPR) repeat protein